MDKGDYLKTRSKLSTLSGIYTFRDKARKPLYIGKAQNLANRIGSYFHGSKSPIIRQMLLEAKYITCQETLSGIEALILESQQIKKYQPRFNTLLRDDKQYFYVGIPQPRFSKKLEVGQASKQFSRIFVTHQPIADTERPITNFIGPFTDGGALKFALKTLRRIFPYCTCKQKHLYYCLNYHLGNCLGFCCLKNPNVSEVQITEYSKNIKNIINILSGKRKNVINKLVKQLKEKEVLADFENLSSLYTQISKLKKFFLNTKVINDANLSKKLLLDMRKHLLLSYSPVRIEGYDISNISGVFATGSMVVFTNAQPDKSEYRKFKIRTITSSNDTGMLREVVERRFRHKEWQFPNLILVDGGKGQVNAISSVLKSLSIDIPVVGIIKNEKHFGERLLLGKQNKIINLDTLPIGVKNLLLQVDSEAHRFAIQYYRQRHGFKK